MWAQWIFTLLGLCQRLDRLRNLRTLDGVNHKQFAKALQDWRESNDYTQQGAADKLGVSRRSLENWEQERAMPQGFGLAAMMKIIGVKSTKAARKVVRRKVAKR